MGTIAIVLGTRPEMIKLAPIAGRLGDRARILHTGQHFDDALSSSILSEVSLTEVAALGMVGGRSRGVQIGAALCALDENFAANRPAMVMVQGDTNAALAGALAANARGIPLVHVEAGLRSNDRAMPEEHNRILIDHISDLLCAPTAGNIANLRAEGIASQRIRLTGNTIVEAVWQHLPSAGRRDEILGAHSVKPDAYVLATLHRPENTDDPAALRTIVTELSDIASNSLPVLLSIHPRTRAALVANGLLESLEPVSQLPPLPYGEFLALARHAAVIVSDSGGVQEEVTVLKRPLVVVRRSTERPESLRHFAALVTPGPALGDAVRRTIASAPDLANARCPYGEHATARIVEAVNELLARTAAA
ncbi:UDP-N-acetylglucosamine 2-epimerase (non-hydrolyzing) [Phytohabitans sp. ZYX-F-186]|uniref:UDP-N-acetylglucosamine 2-epimerase (Non-hydrolyzing) n=1 Tax=Phytohabitans maris TaxID=3071409 RepID=A0ABU0ZVZ6_9ACTN|nr:UDP-N-acetylglucosamine 2-epimerase (non-hydrolyzing) [Phytohabitans sp. ZYX-F-186]MDQ7910986.1 UDP-N-acetylglucosamine 2-epimerase (non-hydrolyzing) [Phytohabitans sp. ZYX-F-186]